ncbi:hypothetical protein [Deinococcus soli (ex Cha et al. 2016)]|uniref:Uncharacterized protein n=2 Tax=Deinococcus soli (ex Cha et al. 2016) TaxID=1309411 RepID=A0AAE3XDF4_9DEIO|nr:hypothetical protein [Deinococcus soli (ex Cha et al. 2016)]MDR6219001.1 hypothetical protein [Deinococcus soli (ex Cha et al. 2016)]MDR6328798.1 hypothetical protein [Deinococcus soli (ex Cha et al. 2016)]MDR6751715.1 hypothetical protein [Deinococcus soli (ex Cha et al. 2016)]
MEPSLLETALSTLITRDAPPAAVALVTAALVTGAAMGAAPLWLGAARRQPLPAAAGFMGSTLAALLPSLYAVTHGGPWALAGIGAAAVVSVAAALGTGARRAPSAPSLDELLSDLHQASEPAPAGADPEPPRPVQPVPVQPLDGAAPVPALPAAPLPDEVPPAANPDGVFSGVADLPAPDLDVAAPQDVTVSEAPAPAPDVIPAPPALPTEPDMDLSSLFSAPPAEVPGPASEVEDVDLSALFAPVPAEADRAPAEVPGEESALRDCTALIDGIVQFDAVPAGARATINGERAGRLPVRVSGHSGDVFEYVFSHPKLGRVEGRLVVP